MNNKEINEKNEEIIPNSLLSSPRNPLKSGNAASIESSVQSPKAPLYERLVQYARSEQSSFHVPGHKNGIAYAELWQEDTYASYLQHILQLDVTEIQGTDDLHHPEGVIKEAQELAAKCFGAEETHWLVGGSTSGNIALLLTVCSSPGDLIIVQRNVHKSIIHGLMLANAKVVFLAPKLDPASKLAVIPQAEVIKQALLRYPEAKAVMLTSPNYYGMGTDLTAIADCCHNYGVPLLIDEAHGAHYGHHLRFPNSALAAGADGVVQSTHKMLSAMTMGAMLHIQGGLLNKPLLKQRLTMIQSSSPSYPLMASLDLSRYLLDRYEDKLFEKGLIARDYFVQHLLKIPSLTEGSEQYIQYNEVHSTSYQGETYLKSQSPFGLQASIDFDEKYDQDEISNYNKENNEKDLTGMGIKESNTESNTMGNEEADKALNRNEIQWTTNDHVQNHEDYTRREDPTINDVSTLCEPRFGCLNTQEQEAIVQTNQKGHIEATEQKQINEASLRIQQDPFKVVLYDRAGQLSGTELQEQLETYQCIPEMSDDRYVVLVFSLGSRLEDAERLLAALTQIAINHPLRSRNELLSNNSIVYSHSDPSHLIPAESERSTSVRSTTLSTSEAKTDKARLSDSYERNTNEDIHHTDFSLNRINRISEPVQFQMQPITPDEVESVLLAEAKGRYSAEMVIPYPPGIPIVYPGERISEEIHDQLLLLVKNRIRIQGANDSSLSYVEVYRHNK